VTHSWSFFRAGGVDQISIGSGADILALPTLDQKLWFALAMPTRDIDVDARTLDLLDTDRDGRIRVPDVLAAVEWIRETWRDPDDLLRGGDELALTAIKEGPVLAAARRLVVDIGKKDAKAISLADAEKLVEAVARTRLNGDGVIVPDTAEDDDTRKAIEEIIAAVGSVLDRSGKQGIDKDKTATFFADIDKLVAWADTRPAGDGLDEGADALAAVRAKIDEYFTRCRLAAFDDRAAAALDTLELGGALESSKLPLARVAPGRALPLRKALNPAWSAQVGTFATAVVGKVLGPRDELSEDDFGKVVAHLAPIDGWRAARPVSPVGALALERIRALAAPAVRARIGALIEADRALEADYAATASVEKLLRFQRDFVRILRTFVTFSDFYTKRDGAFQIGSLYIDGRTCQLCVPVADAGRHATLASLSGGYLLYCDTTRGAEKRPIVAVMTNGDGDNLMVGRNGVFYDRDGKDWDATITKIVTNPISVREAFWAPYKRLARMIDEAAAKRAAAADAASTAKIDATAATVANVDPHAAAAAASPNPTPPVKKMDVGTVAAIGVAIGGIGAILIGILTMFLGLGLWMPVGLLALVLLISLPSMVLAWLKLRQRNLAPILDANGWALNQRARVNISFGAALTDLAKLPKGAKRTIDDPYADKRTPWKLYTFLIAVVLLTGTWYAGKLDRLLPHVVRSTTVLGENAPSSGTVPLR
jgi:hypothetical protein